MERGVCGKDETTAALHDLVIRGLRGVAAYAHRAGQLGARAPDVDRTILQGLFTTVTNVNFDVERLTVWLRDLVGVRDTARTLYERACAEAGKKPEKVSDWVIWSDSATTEELLGIGATATIQDRIRDRGAEPTGLEELFTYGLKGLAAYAEHAWVLGRTDDEVLDYVREALDALNTEHSAQELLGMCLRLGEVNLRVMEMLDAAHNETFGAPRPTPVRTTPVAGKAILVSGHDLADLQALLEQTAGTGINVYTHSEMLPAHGYPELKKFPHLVGNFGGAWVEQQRELANFPGAILFTTNCIQEPTESYSGRVFTTGLVGWPGVEHVNDRNFGPVIEAALAAPGFKEDEPEQTITVGFGHAAVLGVAGQVIEAVKSGDIRHFFLIGGCDGAKAQRNYYTELAEKVPGDCVVLTLGCGKYRFNKHEFGDIGGIPRLLDVGQCNDAYSAIRIASALADAFETDVNGLPLSLVLSWFEQKAVCILLTLLHLGVRNIRIGPSLPAFVPPDALELLVSEYGLTPIGTPDEDLRAMLG